MHKQRKLKHYLIFPRFQLTLVIVNLLIMTFAYALVFYQVYDSFGSLTEVGHRLRIPEGSAFYKLINHHQAQIQFKLLVAAGFSYLISFALTVVISHKVSGPLYRLRMYFTQMKDDGHTADLSFRKGDYYSDLPDIINEGLHKIKKE
jgi:hypothetical protein